ncbi:Uncharacterized protein TCM_014746 [Theobroma cacao]|uniref:HMA domain-containing protein n=1 Tax=Theobroma cacao TaxID=3641 RepID=A0A061G0B7_THECC|nr:Uncharacterized protein TCM_014746 [Theobroma cacao]
MEHRQALPTCTLKVNINCCTMCRLKVKEKLQKIKGVESIVYDSDGVVTVSGKVNPMTIVKKLEKWGKYAELLSFRRSPKQDVQGSTSCSNKGVDNSDHHGSHSKMEKDCCCRCDAVSDSDDDHDHGQDDNGEVPAAKKSNASITCQHPDPTISKQSRKGKVKKRFIGLFSKNIGGAKKNLDETKSRVSTIGKPSTMDRPSKWRFPWTPMPKYGGPMPYNRPFESYPPPVTGRPAAPPYHPFGLMRPPPSPAVPPPYGFFNSRPPPKVNPMIHYTSYADNYSYW